MTAFFDLPVRRHEVNGIHIAARIDGQGPLLLLHGHPQTHAIWHRVWPELTRRHTCVAADLRGYGDSDKPAASPDHAAHSKRAMAADMVALMRALGHERFDVLAHDRGARVAHRLALDHADAVGRMMLLDIAPTLDMYENTTRAFAQAYYHWFWLIQPAPMPETMIERDPVFYLRSVMGGAPAAWRIFPTKRWPSTSAPRACPAGPPASARTTAPRPRSTWSTTARDAPRASACACRCASCGASAARWGAISTCWACGARWRTTSPADRCPAPTTWLRKRQTPCCAKCPVFGWDRG
ncbi:alpha/beta fold hydrolase [Achromobacter insuavis]